MNDEANKKPPINRARFRVRVRTRSGKSSGLRLAIGHGHTLNLIEAVTPCEEEFTASEYTVLEGYDICS